MTFFNEIEKFDRAEITRRIFSATDRQVEAALAAAPNVNLDHLIALLSPAADKYLEQMAMQSSEITRRRFGNVMQLYIPLYISNYCSNRCVYCGFNAGNKIRRSALTMEEIAIEAEAIQKYPFRHILLVTGESAAKSGVEYLGNAIEVMNKYFEQTSIEVQPLDTSDYAKLIDRGLHSVYVYQETYSKEQYPLYHLAGKKSNYRYRLETPDRLGEAGVHKIGVANLIGLEEWRTEAFFTALHVQYISNKYWRTKSSIAFPRLRPFTGGDDFAANYVTTERNLLQLICAYRLFSEDVELSLSTRESPFFRDHVMRLGITTVSAGSKTAPGGYSDYDKNKELEQFAVNDDRAPELIVESIKEAGLEPVWKDWDRSLFKQTC
ncbi:MAG: 2-iminoacetate synthase ThiH [Rikenellaceae bacterium]